MKIRYIGIESNIVNKLETISNIIVDFEQIFDRFFIDIY